QDRFVDETALLSGVSYPILVLYPTPDGALWIGFEGGGLGRLKNGNLTRLGSEQGLSDDSIAQIVADDRDYFWFGGVHGIFKVRRSELEDVMEQRAGHVRCVRYGRN